MEVMGITILEAIMETPIMISMIGKTAAAWAKRIAYKKNPAWVKMAVMGCVQKIIMTILKIVMKTKNYSKRIQEDSISTRI